MGRARGLRVGLAALVLAAGSVVLAGSGKPTCELLSPDEVARVAGGAVDIDRSASGEDDRGGDNCVWKVKGQPAPAVLIRVERAPSLERAKSGFAAAKIDAFGGGAPPTRITGLGDEALYRDFAKVKGGALVIRMGTAVIVFSGSVPKDGFVTLGRLVTGRL